MYLLLLGFALCNLLYFALHTTPTGSFPKPLSAKDEQECLEAISRGDEAARHKLIEHNLRLVAHIINIYYLKMVRGYADFPMSQSYDYKKGSL
jgi:RNA polymerase sporulation-specific sigma factor